MAVGLPRAACEDVIHPAVAPRSPPVLAVDEDTVAVRDEVVAVAPERGTAPRPHATLRVPLGAATVDVATRPLPREPLVHAMVVDAALDTRLGVPLPRVTVSLHSPLTVRLAT